MAIATYRLPDEPLPSGLAKYAVDPMWPLLAVMLGGNVLGLAWFVFNGIALGSPTRTREWLYVALSLLGSSVLFLLLDHAARHDWLQGSELRYAGLSIVALKLCIAYVLYMTQQRCFEIWEHYGGTPRNGVPVLILAAVVGRGLVNSEQWPVLLKVIFQ